MLPLNLYYINGLFTIKGYAERRMIRAQQNNCILKESEDTVF